jgi:teichuronic acid biosynthesis glycosyltransferase TuaG
MSDWRLGLVSVIMPVYNQQDVLIESVRSVMAQTFPDWELLIVDDASNDETLPNARQLACEDSRIRVISLPENAGVANARNTGMKAARGQYLAFLDSDDLWLPEKLRFQVEFMKRQNVGFSFTRYRRFRPNGFLGKPIKIPGKVDYEGLLKGNVIGCLTVMIDREKIPDFSMPAVRHEDYVAWLHILKQGHAAWGIQEDLARYRISSPSVSGNKRLSAVWTWEVYRRIEKLSLIKALWCFTNYSLRAFSTRFIC